MFINGCFSCWAEETGEWSTGELHVIADIYKLITVGWKKWLALYGNGDLDDCNSQITTCCIQINSCNCLKKDKATMTFYPADMTNLASKFSNQLSCPKYKMKYLAVVSR